MKGGRFERFANCPVVCFFPLSSGRRSVATGFLCCARQEKGSLTGETEQEASYTEGGGGSLTNIVPHRGRKIMDTDDIISWGGVKGAASYVHIIKMFARIKR